MSDNDNVVQMMNANPPPVAGEVPNDPNVVGTLTQQEMETLAGLRRRGSQLVMQIGAVEVQKARMLGDLDANENQAEAVMQGISKRMGISDGQRYQIMPDGKVRLVEANPPMESPPAQ
jgi:hypothetical protein